MRSIKVPAETKRNALARRLCIMLLTSAAIVSSFSPKAAAQSAEPPASPQSQTLPDVVVETPTAPPKPAKTKSTKKAAHKSQSAQAPATPTSSDAATQSEAPETATSPVNGIVAKVSGTATKNDTPLLETPQSVSVVTREQMDQQGAQSVPQALQYSSGLVADTRANFSGFDIVYGRGFFLDRYLDGLRYPPGSSSTTAQIEVYGLERLEYLHGPASVLYGASSPGGIIEAISKRPLDEPYHEVSFTFGNFDYVETAFDFSDKMTADGKWSYRLTGLTRDFDSQVDFNSQERYFIAPSLTWKPVTGTSLTFLGNFQHDPKTGLYAQLPLYGLPDGAPRLDRSTYLGEPGYNDNHRDQQAVGYALESKIDDTWTVRQNLRYMHVDGTLDQFQPLPPAFGGGVTFNSATGQYMMGRYVLTSDTNQNQFAVDSNAEAKFDTGPIEHKLLFGVDYQRYQETAFFQQAFGSPINVYNPQYGNIFILPLTTSDTNQVLNQTGIYVQDQVKLDRILLTLGIRQDYSDVETTNYLTGGRTDQRDNAFTQRYGITYLLDGGLAPYFSYATSFQPVVGVNTATQKPFDPTTGEQYEVGVKYQPTGYNALFTLAAYNLTQQNVRTTNALLQPVQTGEIRSRGIEFESKFNLTKNFDVIGSYTYTEAETTKDPNKAVIGRRPLNIPMNTAALWGYYTFHKGWTNGIGFGAGVRYVGDSAGDPENSFFVSAHTLFDLAAAYDFGKLSPRLDGMSVQLNVQNVGDLTYVAQCVTTLNCSYGNGRTILTTLKYQW